MPRPKPDITRTPVLLRLDPDLLARVDACKGAVRTKKFVWLLELGLQVYEGHKVAPRIVMEPKGQPRQRPAPEIVEERAAKMGVYLQNLAKLSFEMEAEAFANDVMQSVQFGPTKTAPGSRLPKSKPRKG